jgi:hypothetical protein
VFLITVAVQSRKKHCARLCNALVVLDALAPVHFGKNLLVEVIFYVEVLGFDGPIHVVSIIPLQGQLPLDDMQEFNGPFFKFVNFTLFKPDEIKILGHLAFH